MEPIFSCKIWYLKSYILPLMFRLALETLDPPLLKTLAEYSSASSPNTSLIISIWRLPSSMISNLWSSKISLEPLYLKQMIFVYVQRKNINSILYYYLFCITSKHSILGCTWTRKQKTVYTSNKITTKSSTFTLYNHYAKRIKKKFWCNFNYLILHENKIAKWLNWLNKFNAILSMFDLPLHLRFGIARDLQLKGSRLTGNSLDVSQSLRDLRHYSSWKECLMTSQQISNNAALLNIL